MGTLRTIFALAVALGHAGGFHGFELLNADTAVEAFYAISGFYMAMVFTEKYAVAANPKLTFWLNRYLRLAPAYLFLGAIAIWLVYPERLAAVDFKVQALVILSQITIWGQDIFLFLGLDQAAGHIVLVKNFHTLQGTAVKPLFDFVPIPQGWTLGVEASFYALVPWLARRRTRWLAGLCAASLGLHLAAFYLLDMRGDPWTYRFFPFELAIFLFGMLAYRAVAAGWGLRHQRAIFAAIVALAVLYHYLPGGGSEKRWTFLVLFTLALPAIFRLTRSSRRDRWIGELSYPIYICHLLVFDTIGRLTGGRLIGGPWQVPLELAAVVLCAWAINTVIEQPVDRLRARLTRPAHPAPRAITS